MKCGQVPGESIDRVHGKGRCRHARLMKFLTLPPCTSLEIFTDFFCRRRGGVPSLADGAACELVGQQIANTRKRFHPSSSEFRAF